VAVALGLLIWPNQGHADLLEWDANSAVPPNPAGGSGTWTATDANWWNGSANQAYDTGTAPHDTLFGVTGGTVYLGTPVSARSLRFDVGGYTLSGADLTLAGTGENPHQITVTGTAGAAVLAAPVVGTGGLVKSGVGTLVLSGANSFAGLTVLDGAVSVSADEHMGDTEGGVILDGGTLIVTGSGPLTAAPTRDFFIGDAGGSFHIQNTSNTGLTIGGILSGMGTLVKTGAGTLRLDDTNHMFLADVRIEEGIFRFNDNDDAGPKALRGSRVVFVPTGGTATLSLGGSGDAVTGEGSELRTGEWVSATAGAGQVLAATTVTDPAIGASGHDVLILALADATFSGTVNNLATATGGVIGTNSQDGDFAVRGIASQTLSGTTLVNGTVTIASGAGLTLAGDAAMTGDAANLNINGGTFTLDNTDTNLPDRFGSVGSVETRGGGTLQFVGNAAGSSESLGKINLGTSITTPPNPRSGALNVTVVHAAGASASTVLTFAELQRDSGRATINFSAADAAGPLALGQPGSAPRILFAAPPATSASGLLSSPEGTGWATVNGTDFATYDPTTGVKAVATVPFATATSSDNALITTTEVISGSLNKTVGSLTISPSAGQTLDLADTANLVTEGILLAGPEAFRIRNAGGGTGGLVTSGSQHVYVQEAALTVGVPITGTGALVKSGPGTLTLEGMNTYAGPTTINEGTLRATPGVSLGPGVLELRGGVLEITGGGIFNRHLDAGTPSGPGRVSWSAVTGLPLPDRTKEDAGSGGLAAVGADVIVDLNGLGPSDIVWEDPSFLRSGYAMTLGSRNADARIELVDNFGLGLSPQAYNPREVCVIDNPDSTADVARLSGIIFGDTAANNGMLNDLLKTGNGILELTGDNTYIGGTIIAEGTLLLGHTHALGRPAPGAYVLLGNRGESADAALLASTPISIDRDITVQGDGSGSASRILGGSNTSGTATFSGNVVAHADLDLTAAPGDTVQLTGVFDNAEGRTLTKVGEGILLLDGPQTHGPGALLDILAGTVFMNTNAGSKTAANLSVSVADAELYLGTNQYLDTLTISDGGKVVLAGAQVVVLKRLVMNGVDLGATTLTPEPATLALLAPGLLGVLARRRRS
jgi:autotransporter-associated beta strand protein